MKIVITGSRNWREPNQVAEALESWNWISGHRLEVGVGDCPTGADKFTRDWCKANEVPCTVFVADWERYGKAAGPMRNKTMVDEMNPAFVLAFLHPDSRGTKHCADYAASKGITVLPYRPKE